MEQKLYGAALFLNPAKFFGIKENDKRQAARLRSMFNDVLWKMVSDDKDQTMISKQADDYERSEGECFSKQLAIKDRTKKNPSKFLSFYGSLVNSTSPIIMQFYLCFVLQFFGGVHTVA